MSDEPNESNEKKGVNIFVNNREVHFANDDATGAEIKARGDVPQDFKLFGPEGEPIEQGERIELHDGARFTAISGQDVS
jgi:hypothetical protein